jgi:hypothetical protein
MPIGKNSGDVIGKSQKISYDPKTGQIFVSALKSKDNGFNVGGILFIFINILLLWNICDNKFP